MLAPTTPRQQTRPRSRDESDLTNTEGSHLQPRLPAAADRNRKRTQPMRRIVTVTVRVPRDGMAWRLLAEKVALRRPVFHRFARLPGDAGRESPNHPFPMRDSERRARTASPGAALTDTRAPRPPRLAACAAGTPAKGSKVVRGHQGGYRRWRPRAACAGHQLADSRSRRAAAAGSCGCCLFALLRYVACACAQPRAPSRAIARSRSPASPAARAHSRYSPITESSKGSLRIGQPDQGPCQGLGDNLRSSHASTAQVRSSMNRSDADPLSPLCQATPRTEAQPMSLARESNTGKVTAPCPLG